MKLPFLFLIPLGIFALSANNRARKADKKLSEEIWETFVFNQQSEDLYRIKIAFWKYLNHLVKKKFPHYRLFLVGSTISGFGTNKGDIDMCLVVRNSKKYQRVDQLHHLGNLLEYLQTFYFAENLDLKHAKVPVLTFRVANEGLNVDLNCNNAIGVRNTHLLFSYAQDGVSPKVLPCLERMHHANFPSNADPSQIYIHEDLPPRKSENNTTLGELLFGFFKYYTFFDRFAISVRLGSTIPVDKFREAHRIKDKRHSYLNIEEPFDLTNTARSVIDLNIFHRIRRLINSSYKQLKKSRNSLDSIFKFHLCS